MATNADKPLKEEKLKKEEEKKTKDGVETTDETEMNEEAEKGAEDKIRTDESDKVEEGADGKTVAKDGKTPEGQEGKKAKKKRLRFLYKSLCEQMEFYFSDANLSREGFLMKLINDSPEGWVDLKQFLTFNKIKEKTDDVNAVMHSLKKSEMLEVDPDRLLVRRKTPFKELEDRDERTVYVENLPNHVNLAWMKQKFSKCGSILYVSIPRFKSTKDPKGFAFIEFDTKEAAAKAVETLNNPEPAKKPGMFPKGNKTLDSLRKKAGDEGAVAEQVFTRDKTQGKGSLSASWGDTSNKPSGSAGPSHKKKRKESSAAAEEGMEVAERREGQETSSNLGKRRRESQGEGEGWQAKKQKRSKGEDEGDDAAVEKQECEQEGEDVMARKGAGQGEQARKRKRREEDEKTAAGDEDKVFGEEKGSSPEEDEEGPSPTKRKFRSLSVPAVLGRDSTDEPGPLERQQSDPGKTSAEDEKSGSKHKKKKKKKKKHKHTEDKKPQEGDAAKGTKPDDKASKGGGGGRTLGGKGDRRKRKNFEAEVVSAAPKILKSAISSDKSGRPQKKVTIKEDPPEELGAKKEKKIANGQPGKKKNRRKSVPHSERKGPSHLRVMPKSEWLTLREEYKKKQKELVHTLKETLKKMETPQTKKEASEEPKFVASTIVSMQCPGPVSRKQLLKALGSEVEVAYIDINKDTLDGFIRCKDKQSAFKILDKSEEMPEYKFDLLQGEKEQDYWEKLHEDRKKKFDKESVVQSKRGGKKRLNRKVQRLSIVAKERKHIIFDED